MKEFMESKGLGKTEASLFFDISRSTLNKYLSGVTEPKFTDAIDMMACMDVSLFAFDNRRKPLIFKGKKVRDIENFRTKKVTVKEYRDEARREMNEVMAIMPGFHRDHIIPVSFCKKIGATPKQCSMRKNLTYLSPVDNKNKSSIVADYHIAHLEEMCEIWGVEMPSREFIDEHNSKVRGFLQEIDGPL